MCHTVIIVRVALLQIVLEFNNIKERRQQLLKEFETYPIIRKKRGSLHGSCKGFLSSLKEVFEVLPPPPRVLRDCSDFKNLYNGLLIQILRVNKMLMYVFCTLRFCFSEILLLSSFSKFFVRGWHD